MTTRREIKRNGAVFHFSDLICAVALAGLLAASVAMFTGTPGEMKSLRDFTGVLFLAIAAFYGGTMRSFWLILAPIGLALLFAPIAHWEAHGSFLTLNDLLRTALVPGLSFVGAGLLTTVRQTVLASHEGQQDVRALETRSGLQLKRLRQLEFELRELLPSVRRSAAAPKAAPVVQVQDWEKVEYRLDESLLQAQQVEAAVMTFAEIQALAEREVEKLSAALEAGLTGTDKRVSLKLSIPIEVPVPLAVRADQDRLELAVRGLLISAVESLGGQGGLIRITLRPDTETVALEVEDNGRGFSETVLARLEEKGVLPATLNAKLLPNRLSFARIRTLIETSGWRLDRPTRLGVGSRAEVLLPRVDGGRFNVRNERLREVRREGVIVDPSAVVTAAEIGGWKPAPRYSESDAMLGLQD